MDKAIIFAGGKGERLRPLTQDLPKPMVPLADDKPLLSVTLSWLKSQGINHVAICCGYRHDVILNYFGDGKKYDPQLDYLIEDEPLGRGGALKRALLHLNSDQPVLAMNGDLLTDLDIAELEAFHTKTGGMATIVTTNLVSPYGIVETTGTRVTSFREKPVLPQLMNAGIYVLEPAIAQHLPDRGDHEVETFPLLASRGELHAFHTKAFWRTIDTMKDLTELRKEIPEASLATSRLRSLLSKP